MFLVLLVVIIYRVYVCVKIPNCMLCVQVFGYLIQTLDTNKFEDLQDFPVGVSIRELEIHVCI